MPMSEHEQKILEQLEDEFRAVAVSPVQRRWRGLSRSRRIAAASLAFPIGLLLVSVGVALGHAVGIMLSVLAYILIVGSVCTIIDCTSGRRELKRIARANNASRRPRYF